MIANPMKPISRRGSTHFRQFIKFNLVGILNTLVDVLVFALLLWLGVHYIVSQCISYGCGIANSYVLNKRWTFGQTSRSSGGQLIKFITVNLTVLAISVGLLYFVVSVWPLSELVAKMLVTFITMTINFLANRLWVFNSKNL